MMNNQLQEPDMLHIAINSSEYFTDDIHNPGIPDPFKDRGSLEALLKEPIKGTSENSMSWSVGPDWAVVDFPARYTTSSLMLWQQSYPQQYLL